MALALFTGVYLAGPTAGRNRAVSLRSERAMSRAYPSAELDTVVEERSDPDLEATAVEVCYIVFLFDFFEV